LYDSLHIHSSIQSAGELTRKVLSDEKAAPQRLLLLTQCGTRSVCSWVLLKALLVANRAAMPGSRGSVMRGAMILTQRLKMVGFPLTSGTSRRRVQEGSCHCKTGQGWHLILSVAGN